MAEVNVNISFTDRAVRLLPPGQTSVRLAGLSALSQRPTLGDMLRIQAIPNCPWFVVAQRYWEIGETTTLTIWLDEPEG